MDRDLMLRDLTDCLHTSQAIRLNRGDTGEAFSPSIRDFKMYEDWYVIKVWARDSELNILILSEI